LIVQERERLAGLLEGIPYLRPFPSPSNFVLCRVLGREATQVKDALEREGILIRYYRAPRLKDCFRISVGTPEQTDTLITALRRLP